MPHIVVTAASSPLGTRVVELLGDARVDVVAVSGDAEPSELKSVLDAATAVVHLGPPTALRDVLDAAAGVEQVVVASSTAVYGAWADNPVPLTEDAPLRPNPGYEHAAAHAEAERVAAEWRDDHPGAAVAVLRLAPVLVPGRETRLSATLGRPPRLRPADALAPTQYLHVDDAASAVVHALVRRLAGTYNVAPDGSVDGETARALSGTGLTLGVPERTATWVERWAWRLGVGGRPAASAPYVVHAWVVANDRFRATGWEPVHTNEEALVAARRGSWWRELSPKRRQEVTLAAAGSAVVALVTAAVTGVRSMQRRSARR